MPDTLSSASIKAANTAPAPVQAVKVAVEADVTEAETFVSKHEKAFVIGACVALFVFVAYLVSTL